MSVDPRSIRSPAQAMPRHCRSRVQSKAHARKTQRVIQTGGRRDAPGLRRRPVGRRRKPKPAPPYLAPRMSPEVGRNYRPFRRAGNRRPDRRQLHDLAILPDAARSELSSSAARLPTWMRQDRAQTRRFALNWDGAWPGTTTTVVQLRRGDTAGLRWSTAPCACPLPACR